LYNYKPDYDPRPATFQVIGSTHLPPLVSGGGTAGADTAASTGPDKVAIAGRDSWKPLIGGGGTAGSPGAPSPADFAGMGRGKFAGGFGRASEGGGETGGNVGGGTPQAATNADVKKGKPRYEFIVMFIWREPTPSDALMKSESAGQ
jgi:hypothetical protein